MRYIIYCPDVSLHSAILLATREIAAAGNEIVVTTDRRPPPTPDPGAQHLLIQGISERVESLADQFAKLGRDLNELTFTIRSTGLTQVDVASLKQSWQQRATPNQPFYARFRKREKRQRGPLRKGR